MKIILSPDSFKGSASAIALCAAMRRGVERQMPDAEIVELPLSDGGEGLIENLVYACQGQVVEAVVQGPLGDPVNAHYGIIEQTEGKTAVIELAQASGLTLLAEGDRNPLHTFTYGTGQLMMHALDQEIRHFILGLGGSATNDGGAGLARALGIRFLDAQQRELPQGGKALGHLASIDLSQLDRRLYDCQFLIACDVTNPLTGPDGATYVFGPQKGATAEMLPDLDQALSHYASMLRGQTGRDVAIIPGSGAAGGTAAALAAFFNARLVSGIDVFLDAIRYDQHLAGASLVMTGEGKLDEQTLSGKVIHGVCKRASTFGIPVMALCGGMDISAEQMDRIGLTAAFSIVQKPCSLVEAMEQTLSMAERQVEQIIRLARIHV